MVPIFKTKDLADIANGRLRKLIERTCAWGESEVAYIPGLKNVIADTGSRYPEQSSDINNAKPLAGVRALTAYTHAVKKNSPVYNQEENLQGYQWTEEVEARVAIIQATLGEIASRISIRALTTQMIREAGNEDYIYSILKNALANGHFWPQDIPIFNRYKL